MELLSAPLASGRAHIADRRGGAAADAAAWGWREVTRGSGEYARTDYEPQGRLVGWLADEGLYLLPDPALAAARAVGEAVADPLAVSPAALRKRLHEAGYLASVDAARQTLTVRRSLQGAQRDVLHFPSGPLSVRERPDKPDSGTAAPPFAAPGAAETDSAGAARAEQTRHSDTTPDSEIPRHDAENGPIVGFVGFSRNSAGAAADGATTPAPPLSGVLSGVGNSLDQKAAAEAGAEGEEWGEWRG